MTIKEIAELTGKTERAVQFWVKNHNEKISLLHNEKISFQRSEKISLQKGHETDFNLDETIEILRAGKISEMFIEILKENVKLRNLQHDFLIISKELDSAKKKVLQLEYKEEIPFHFLGYDNRYYYVYLKNMVNIGVWRIPIKQAKYRLEEIAPINKFWSKRFPSKNDSEKFDRNLAYEWFTEECSRNFYKDRKRVR